jgi:sugar phosphate permease
VLAEIVHLERAVRTCPGQLGVGFALAFPSINAQATAGVAEHEQGLASGLVNTSIQVGGAVVLAVATAIIGDNPTAVHGELLPGMATTIAVVVGVSAAGLLLTGPRALRSLLKREEA